MTMDEEADLKQGLLLSTEKQAHDDDTEAQATVGRTEGSRCPLSLRTSILALLAVLSCLWLYSANVIYPVRRSVFTYAPPREHEHHHKHHHHSHGNGVTVHAGDVFMIQWAPDATAEHAGDSTISLYLHCGGKMGTLVVPIAVDANDTGRHYWALPVDLVESDNYSIKFVPGTCKHKKHARPVFYSQTFTVKQRVRRVKRQETESSADAGATTGDVPSVTVPSSADTPIAPTTPVAPTTPTTPAAPTTPTTPPAPTTPTTPAPSPSSTEATTTPPSSSEPAPPPTTAESSSTSTSFSQVLNTVVVTVTSVNNGVTVTSVATAVQTSEMAVGTSVVGASTGGKKSSKGPIIGGVVGGLLIVGALIGLGVWFFLRKRRRDQQRRYMTPAPDYVHDHAHKPSPPVSPFPDKSPTLPNLTPIPMPPPPRRARPNQPPPGAGLAPPSSSDGAAGGHHSEGESQMSPISELPADQEPSELYAGPVSEDKLGAATTPPAGGYATHEPAPQYSAYVNGSNVGPQSNNPYFPPSSNEASYRGVAGPTQAPRYPENPSSYGSGPTGTPYGSYQDRARMAYHDRGASMTSNTSGISVGASPVSPNPGGLQHSTSVASHGSGVSGVSGVSWNQRLEGAAETASEMSAEGAKPPDGTRYETSARGGAPSSP